MKKIKLIALLLVISTVLLAGCGAKQTKAPGSGQADLVTAASMVSDQDSLLKAASKDGTWIICLTKDIVVDKEIVLEGEFKNRGEVDRKIALYSQDENRNKTATYTLEAPKLIVRSENTRIQGGTFKGDVYVEANGFRVIDATIEGNVYFAKEEYKSSFKLENGGNVTGSIEVQ
ncbi:MAG: hypothetical protein GX066_09940 [Clostridiaceae bacterium]|nr:hypothetical protein [Clostridiaceae bacterium]